MYTTLEKVVARLSNYDDTFDELIEDLIEQVSARIDSYCERKFLRQTFTDELHDGLNSNDGPVKRIFLKNFPVASISSISQRTSKAATDTWEAYYTYDYDLDSDAGIVTLIDSYFPSERRNIKCTYSAGYLIEFENENNPANHTLPKDITLAATEMVVRYFNRREKSGLDNENTGGGTVTYTQGMDKDVAEILDKYKKVEFVV